MPDGSVWYDNRNVARIAVLPLVFGWRKRGMKEAKRLSYAGGIEKKRGWCPCLQDERGGKKAS